MFYIFELFVILVFLWLAANLIRYCFSKTGKKGGIFKLSDSWLNNDETIKNEEKKDFKNGKKNK